MSKHTDLGQYTEVALGHYFALAPMDLGKDAHLSKRGMTFDTKAWEIRDKGHLCVMRMNAFFGLMKMETAVIAPFEADLPLFNVDWVKAFGTETQIAELYDVQLEPWPGEAQKKYEAAAAEVADIAEHSAGEHWYDAILYPCSFHKKGKGLTDRLDKAAEAYIDLYAEELFRADKCPANQKRERVSEFAHKLVENDGPAVNMMAKLFGVDLMKKIVLNYMYGVE